MAKFRGRSFHGGVYGGDMARFGCSPHLAYSMMALRERKITPRTPQTDTDAFLPGHGWIFSSRDGNESTEV